MFCQKCRAPLALDPSISELNTAAYNILIVNSSQEITKTKVAPPNTWPHDSARRDRYNATTKSSTGPVFRRQGGPEPHDLLDGTMSFIQLTERSSKTSSAPKSTQSHGKITTELPDSQAQDLHRDIQRINKLFEILSARSDIDHPICMECTDLLIEELQKKLETATKERDAYIQFLKKVQSEQPTPADIEAQKNALAAEKAAEADATAELLALEEEKAELDKEILVLEKESQELDAAETEFWMQRNNFAEKLSKFQEERDSINAMYDHDSRQLERLQRTNVYNDTFFISHDGTFATINGLRLGRLSSKPVDWSEINAAWGYALLLIDTVAKQLKYRFVGYELQPMGNTSRIIKLEISQPTSARNMAASTSGTQSLPPVKRTPLDLYSSGDMPLGLTFMHRKFDNAMVAFLELVRQLGDFVKRETAKLDRTLELPYGIDGDRIKDVSIKLGIAHDDAWSDACKYTLTCCKFLLAHASNLHAMERERERHKNRMGK